MGASAPTSCQWTDWNVRWKYVSIYDGGALGVQGGGSYVSSSSNQTFGNKNQDLVYGLIRQSMDEAGIDRDTIFNQAKKSMTKNEMDNALDFLSSEGHIYSTIDEDHFKTTDGD